MTKLQRFLWTVVFLGLAVLFSGVVLQVAEAVLRMRREAVPTRGWTPTATAVLLASAATAKPPALAGPTSPPATATASPSPTLPPTWTPTFTPSPWPTWTPIPPTPTETPTPLPPRRPTAVVLEMTPTPNPSMTISIPTPVPRQPIPADALTIVLLGSDKRPDWSHWNTDAIQFLVIYPDIPSVSILSIPRDLYVYLPGYWMGRINTADMYGEKFHYDGGGPGLLNQTLLYNLGITADYYVRVNFDGLIGLVNALGGIDVPVHCRLEDYWPYPDENGEYPRFVLEPGVHHLDGEQALWYSRSRKTTSVFSREKRQQQVLEAMWRKAKETNLLQAAPALYEQTRGLYETDLGWGNIAKLVSLAMQLEPRDVRIYNIGWREVEPYVTPQGGSVFLPKWEALEPLIADVWARPSPSRAARAAVRVEVWNGTPYPDWDLLAADRLAHAGFSPLIGGPDRRDYPHTQIVFFGTTTKGSGLAVVQRMFGVDQENVVMLPGGNGEFTMRLIVGADYETCPPTLR